MKGLLFTTVLTLFFSLFSFGQGTSERIITADELAGCYQDVFIIDVSKPETFQNNNIYSSQNVTREDMTNPDADVAGIMATQEQMQALLSNLGVKSNFPLGQEQSIVVYDHKGGSDAARFWWILKYYGHNDVRILDGGLEAWGDRNSTVSLFDFNRDTTNYSFYGKVNTNMLLGLEDIKAALDDPNTILVDSRTLEEYEGTMTKDGASRPGRIPGAVHIDWASAIKYDDGKLFKSKDEIRYEFEQKGVTPDKNIICYCHSGVRSSHSYFVLTEVLGFENVQNYDGSWIEWSADESLTAETGAVSPLEYASYSTIFMDTFNGYFNYIWNQITFQANPWYENYFWFLVILSLIVWLLEIVFPWRKNQAIFRKDFWLDFFFMFFNFYIFNLIIFLAFSKFVTKGFYDISGIDLTATSVFDMSSLPWGVQMLIFFLATDFIQWVTHVALHRFNFLWRFHKVHHSVEQMGFAAHLRYHWMETVFYTPMKFIAIMFIGGFAPEQAFIIYFVTIAIGHINHANLNISYGPLKYILNNPRMHIWHHAKTLPHERRYGVNFGITLSIWDYIFRKNYIPESGRDIPLGFDGMDTYPKGFFGLIFSGFRKKN